MRGIERVIAGLLLVGAVAGAAVFAHSLGREESSGPLGFSAAPAATSTVRIPLPPAPRPALSRPLNRPTPTRVSTPAESGSSAVSAAPVHVRPVTVHVVEPKPATPVRPAPVVTPSRPAAPVLIGPVQIGPVQSPSAAPPTASVPPTQLAHRKVTLTPADPNRILATAPIVPPAPTAPVTPALPPTQQAHVKVTLTPTDPN